MKGEGYTEPLVKALESWLKRLPELQVVIEKREERQLKKGIETKIRIKQGAEAAQPVEQNRQTAQIIKPRLPPNWSGQRF